MWSPALLVPLLLLSLWTLSKIKHAFFSPLSRIPGPWYAPFTNLRMKWAVLTSRRLTYTHELHKRYGPVVRTAPNEVSFVSADSFKEILAIGSPFRKGHWYHKMTISQAPVLFSMGDPREAAARRKAMAHGFSKSFFRQNWEPVVRERIELCVDKIKYDALHGGADIFKWFGFVAPDIAAELMFGESLQMLEKGEKGEFMENLELVMLGTAICAEFPLLPLRTLARWLPIDILRRLFLNMAYLQDYTQRAVKQANDPENDRPSVFRYINSNMEKGQGMLTDDCIRDEAMVVMIAGSESSATILTYIIWCSLNDPEVQRKLEEEVKGLDDEYTDSDLEALPYLNAVIEETLRLYGTTSFLPRDAPANGARMSGFFIPGGTTVTTQSYSIQRDRKLWDRPDDFDPSRWIRGTDAGIKQAYHPFSTGSRVCLGINLARMELRLGTAAFFRKCAGARPSPWFSATEMEFEDNFSLRPVGHRCMVSLE